MATKNFGAADAVEDIVGSQTPRHRDQGVLRSLVAEECVADSGSCTVDADCCVSLTCIKAPGAISGTCEPLNVTP